MAQHLSKEKEWISTLKQAGIENPVQELRYIMRHCEEYKMMSLRAQRSNPEQRYLFSGLLCPASPLLAVPRNDCDEMIDMIVARRAKREPLAKIIGHKEFWKHRFITNEHTLDPRPDSEILIETCLALPKCETVIASAAKQSSYDDDHDAFVMQMKILELGVGTGCLILSLLDEWPWAIGIGVDISQDALKVACQNAKSLNLQDRVEFIQSDWCSDVAKQQFDFIISNPPYIADDEEVNEEAHYDPHIALYAKEKGFAAYRTILQEAPSFLRKGGYLVFEIGPSWARYEHDIRSDLKFIKTVEDLAGHDRVVVLQKK